MDSRHARMQVSSTDASKSGNTGATSNNSNGNSSGANSVLKKLPSAGDESKGPASNDSMSTTPKTDSGATQDNQFGDSKKSDNGPAKPSLEPGEHVPGPNENPKM